MTPRCGRLQDSLVRSLPSSIAEFLEPAAHFVLATDVAVRRSKDLDFDRAVCEEFHLPALTRHGDLDHDRLRANSRESVEYLAFVPCGEEVAELRKRIHRPGPC